MLIVQPPDPKRPKLIDHPKTDQHHYINMIWEKLNDAQKDTITWRAEKLVGSEQTAMEKLVIEAIGNIIAEGWPANYTPAELTSWIIDEMVHIDKNPPTPKKLRAFLI